MQKYIIVKGAKENNLKNIDINIPKDKFVVITGVSGSGKSSLAFDTIYAEGQRKYVESLSSYARQFLDIQNKPHADSIEGLSPAIAIEQKTTSKNPRSTVATVTEIYDYLRVLYARIGIPYSPVTGHPIKKQTASQIVDALLTITGDREITLLSPIVSGQKGEHKKEILYYRRLGYEKLRINSLYYDMDDLPDIDKNKKNDIEIVIDKLRIAPEIRQRLSESVENALKISKGILYVHIDSLPESMKGYNIKENDIVVFSEHFSCPISGFALPELEPRIFSFNSPYGACHKCKGLSKEKIFSQDLVIDETLPLLDGGIIPWKKGSAKYSNSQVKLYESLIEGLAKHYSFPPDASFDQLSEKIQNILLYGSGDEEIIFSYQESYKSSKIKKPFRGLIPILEEKFQKTETAYMAEELSKYQIEINCSDCDGYRIKKESLCVKVHDLHIGQFCDFTIDDAHSWTNNLHKFLDPTQLEISKLILKEIKNRLEFLMDVGLNYLTLNRVSSTLSGGESQRIRLASQIGSSLTGVLYVLDEPSIGLHQSDNDKLLKSIKGLRDLGNTVIVVEHDQDTMLAADHLIDIGPYAGEKGGYLIAEGTPKEVCKNEKSITARYLSGKDFIPIPKQRRDHDLKNVIALEGVTTNNLKNVNVKIPIANFVAVTGVSGSGKSSLILQTLYNAIMKKLHNSKLDCGKYKKIFGLEKIDKIIEINQDPIGRNPRSNPATYTGVFTPIRDWYAHLKESKLRGYLSGRFSFNVKGGRCEVCEGDGVIKIEMHFLPDVYVTCEECHGQRYNKETLQITYKGKSIADVLSMSVDEGIEFFCDLSAIKEKLEALHNVGLGYIKIGQPATTLSGGEAQRIKLAKELSKKSTGRTLYILDEPTTGLHIYDVKNLLQVLQQLVDVGNTVVVIEHNLDVIKTADYVIDVGPEGGIKGGEIVAYGTPEDIAKSKKSITGRYLSKDLNKYS